MGKHPWSCIRRINVVKMTIEPKVIYRFNNILILPRTFFTKLKNYCTIYLEPKRAQIVKAILSKRTRLEASLCLTSGSSILTVVVSEKEIVITFYYSFLILFILLLLFFWGSILVCLGWSAVVLLQLNAASISWTVVILPPQPLELLAL